MAVYNVISDGEHFLSGIGHTTIKPNFSFINRDIDVDLFCIDGVTYGAYIDPDDGYRSYGVIDKVTDCKCQYTFPPQRVMVKNEEIAGKIHYKDDDYEWDRYESKKLIRITDAVNGKEVLVVGTDYSEDYYPYAIFHYTPENLEVNKNR